jgi:hypothetical protein
VQDLKDKIIAEFDEASLLDFLGIDMEMLVDLLEEEINERQEQFEQALR